MAPNVWLRSRELMKWTFNNTMRSVEMFNEGFRVPTKLARGVINTINKDDVESANKIIKQFDILRGLDAAAA